MPWTKDGRSFGGRSFSTGTDWFFLFFSSVCTYLGGLFKRTITKKEKKKKKKEPREVDIVGLGK